MDRTKYEAIFDQESQRYLDELEALLIAVEKSPSDQGRWGEIHGKIHSIKGMARALSIDNITSLAHLMEEWCKMYQLGEAEASPPAIQTIFDGTDLLRHLVVRRGTIESFDNQQWYSRMKAAFEKPPEPGEKSGDPGRISAVSRTLQAKPINEVRVRYSLIEELLGLAQEIQLLEKTLPPLSSEQVSAGVKNWLDHATSLMKALYFRLAHLRLMSVADFADLFVNTIRQLAADHGKKVRLEVVGGEIQADITILERLREPLVHLFRNCIAHGIEPPELRKRAGKDPVGKILIMATSEQESLLVTIADDGRGIDREAIVAHLKQHAGLSDPDIERIGEKRLFDTILQPGYSSSTGTNDLAGRGIGMSVVNQAIEYVGGSMHICSTPGRGTELQIRLPLSLSIVHAITFKVDRYTLSIPTSRVASIDRTANLSKEQFSKVNDLKRTLGLQDGNRCFFNVIRLKGFGDNGGRTDAPEPAALGVDGIIGNRPLMVLPVGELVATARVYAGVGIMENGDVSMVLDVNSLSARNAEEDHT